jgi:hypothetical protein
VTFRGLVCLLLPETPPMSVKLSFARRVKASIDNRGRNRFRARGTSDTGQEMQYG